MLEHIQAAIEESARLIGWLRDDRAVCEIVDRMAGLMVQCLSQGGRILACGNGGSMCDAMHFAEELSGRFRRDRPALAALAISDPSHLTCVANDYGFDQVFARGIEAWGRPGDILLCLSTSGNSPNLLAGATRARALGMTIVALLGRDGGKLRPLADHCIVVPARTSDRIQEVHIKIVHILLELIERRLFPENYRA
jgi:D-sedoheptulose 7-phosphate isomerase